MSAYDLPTSAEIGGAVYRIRSDFRAVLDVISVMGDYGISDDERTLVILSIFFEDFDEMPVGDFQEAVDYVQWFVSGGSEPPKVRKPKLMDWEQDFPLIVAPVNRVAGCEVRSLEYLHWWTFLAYYREIGDCLFAQVVSIRKKKSKGKKLDQSEKRFYEENRDLVDFKIELTASEREGLEAWI